MTYAAETFANWAVSSRKQKLSEEVLHHAKRAVIDWYAAYYPGSIAPPATLLEKAFPGDKDVRFKALLDGTAAHWRRS